MQSPLPPKKLQKSTERSETLPVATFKSTIKNCVRHFKVYFYIFTKIAYVSGICKIWRMMEGHGNYYITANIVQVVWYYISDRKPKSNTSDKENVKSSYGQLWYNLVTPKLFHLVVVSYSEMLPIVRGDCSKSQSYKI